MSGFSYGVIEVTQGADDANATPRSQVAAMIAAYVADAHSYAQLEIVTVGGNQAMVDGVAQELATTATFGFGSVTTDLNTLVPNSNGITYTGTDLKVFKFNTIATATSDVAGVNMNLNYYLNGVKYQPGGVPIISSVPFITMGSNTQLSIQALIPMNENDVVTVYSTIVGSNINLTTNQLSTIVSLA